MPRKYTYKEEYREKDPKIKYRKCKVCKEIKKIKKMENSFTCKVCYIAKHGLKRCKKCSLLLYISEFHKNYTYEDGYLPICTPCRNNKPPRKVKSKKNKTDIDPYLCSDKELAQKHKEYLDLYRPYETYRERFRKITNYHNVMRRARVKKACPKWVNKEKIREIYEKCPDGYHVDHIVPLKNDMVCGLHVPWNLQYLTASENISKSNKF